MQRLELLLSAALIALHAQGPNEPFRQRDVRFYAELFANWIESVGKFKALRIHNNQIAREMLRLTKTGTLKKRSHATQPAYVLTPKGLVSCLQNILFVDDDSEQQYVYFKIYFLSNYVLRLRSLLQSAGTAIPTGLKLEIDPLLDWRQVVEQALLRAETDRKRLEKRINDALELPDIVRKLLKERSWAETVAEVEKRYPYELNSMKSLAELCANLPQELAQWELTEGSRKRATQMWQPLLRSVVNYIEELKKLSREIG